MTVIRTKSMPDQKPEKEESPKPQEPQETGTQSTPQSDNPQTGVGRGRYKAARGRTPGATPRGKPHRAAGGYGSRHN